MKNVEAADAFFLQKNQFVMRIITMTTSPTAAVPVTSSPSPENAPPYAVYQ